MDSFSVAWASKWGSLVVLSKSYMKCIKHTRSTTVFTIFSMFLVMWCRCFYKSASWPKKNTNLMLFRCFLIFSASAYRNHPKALEISSTLFHSKCALKNTYKCCVNALPNSLKRLEIALCSLPENVQDLRFVKNSLCKEQEGKQEDRKQH